MEQIQDNMIRRYRHQAGMTLEALAQEMGVSRSQVHKLERGERRLTVEWIMRLSKVLDCRPQDLLPRDEQDTVANQNLVQNGQAGQNGHNGEASEDYAAHAYSVMDLPVYGATDTFTSSVHKGAYGDMTARPAVLQGASKAFAIYMADETMVPRYYAGEMLYVKPQVPVTVNAYALIELKSGRSFVAQITGRTPEQITVRRFNPAAKNTISMTDVVSLSRVVGASES